MIDGRLTSEISGDLASLYLLSVCDLDIHNPPPSVFEICLRGLAFCECVRRYGAAKVEENAGCIGCWDVGCQDILAMEKRFGLLLPEVFERLGMVLCQAMVKDRFYRPYNDCLAMTMYARQCKLLHHIFNLLEFSITSTTIEVKPTLSPPSQPLKSNPSVSPSTMGVPTSLKHESYPSI